MGAAEKEKSASKSGLKKFAPGDVLFHDGDSAESLFIIQKGQIRLFKPKGRGFIEIGVLRAGEVLGEMAFFDNGSQKGGKRSCSASALVPSEAIEISFLAFGKTMAGLNPWFKTIINTLADRLRKTNARVKELESNNVSHYGGKSGYTFLRTADVVRILSVLFLAIKSHGEEKEGQVLIHKNTLRFYTEDVFNLQEAKIEEIINILHKLGYVDLLDDKNGQPKILAVEDLPKLRSFLVFFNTQRTLADDKKLSISYKCEMFLGKILDQIEKSGQNVAVGEVNLSEVIDEFKKMAINMNQEDLIEAQKAQLIGDVIIDNEKMTATVQIETLRSQFPSIQVMNAINKVNDQRSNESGSRY